MFFPVLPLIHCVAWCCNFCACQDCLWVTLWVNGLIHGWPGVSYAWIGLAPCTLVLVCPNYQGYGDLYGGSGDLYGGSGVPYSWLGLVNPGVWCAQLSCFALPVCPWYLAGYKIKELWQATYKQNLLCACVF